MHADRLPLVSVVIPTRNRPKLLARAVASVDAQSYPNIEIVIVDNFSDSPLTERDIPARHPVKIIRRERMTLLPDNRNDGADQSAGEFICFLDDDDFYRPDKISEEAEALLADPSLDFVYADTEQIGPNGEVMMRCEGPPEIHTFLRWRYIHMNALMLRRRTFEQVRFDPEMTTFEDVEFAGRLLRDFKGVHIPQVHAVWNRDDRPDQLTRRNWKRSYENWRRLCQRFDPEIRADKELRRFYHRKMFVLACMFGDVGQALKSALLAVTPPRG